MTEGDSNIDCAYSFEKNLLSDRLEGTQPIEQFPLIFQLIKVLLIFRLRLILKTYAK